MSQIDSLMRRYNNLIELFLFKMKEKDSIIVFGIESSFKGE